LTPTTGAAVAQHSSPGNKAGKPAFFGDAETDAPGNMTRQVKYRSYTPGLNPRRTRLESPGWAGDRQPRKNGSMEQAWRCLPFSESARYGVEIFYPYANPLTVETRNGILALSGDSGPRPERHGGEWPPFRPFGDLYYTYQ